MTTLGAEPATAADSRLARLEDELQRVREELAEARQREELRSAEVSALQERVHEAEARAAEHAAGAELQGARLREIGALKERAQRIEESAAADRQELQEEAGKLRKELEAGRERGAELSRRIDGLERLAADATAKREALEDGLRRAGDDLAAALQQIARIESDAEAISARITANTDAVRRSGSEARSGGARTEALERQMRDIRDRVESAASGVREITEAAGRWEELTEQVEGMRGRLDDSRRLVDDAVAASNAAKRTQDAVGDRIGDAERLLEQLRLRDANREREVRGVLDQLDMLREESSQERDRFLLLQEKVRRRQIEDLEQEIRELKAYARAGADV